MPISGSTTGEMMGIAHRFRKRELDELHPSYDADEVFE